MKKCIALVLAAFSATPSHATPLTDIFDSFFVLGDSLSDNGNTATLVGRIAAQPDNAPQVNFRPPAFAQQPGVSSDGPTWAAGFVSDFEAAGKTAENLSFGSAWASDNGVGPPDLADQIAAADSFDTTFSFYPGALDAFKISGIAPKYPDGGGGLKSRLSDPDERELITVFTGGNDFLGAAFEIATRPEDSQEILSNTVLNTFTSVTQNVEDLFISQGVNDFVIMNVPDFAVIPRFNDPTDPLAFALGLGLSDAAQSYNALLFGTETTPGYVDSLRLRGASVTEVDIFSLLSDPAAIASAGENIDAMNACTVVAQTQSLADCSNFLFWDEIHPTMVGHSLIAQATRESLGQTYGLQPVPLPAPALMLLTALGGLAVFRRRRQRA